MRLLARSIVPALAVLTLALAGCSSPYVITQGLDGPLQPPNSFRIGDIEDRLPDDVALDDRPTAEGIENFRRYLREALEKDRGLALQHDETGYAGYEVRGRILEYKRGSGFMRFLIGFGAGSAKVVTELSLIDLGDGRVVFSGNFEGLATSWLESGTAMYKSVASNFCEAIKKSGGYASEDGPLL